MIYTMKHFELELFHIIAVVLLVMGIRILGTFYNSNMCDSYIIIFNKAGNQI